MRGKLVRRLAGDLIRRRSASGRAVDALRALGPAMDTFNVITVGGLSHLHMDPEDPVPGSGDGGARRRSTDETIDAFVEAGRRHARSSTAEIRHLGGAVGRPGAEHGAVRVRGADTSCWRSADCAVPEIKAAGWAAVQSLIVERLEPWLYGHTYMNFAEGAATRGTLWTEAAHHA